VWKAVVLKDDCMVYSLKNPVKAGDNTLPTPHIFFGIVFFNPTRPIYGVDNSSCRVTKTLLSFIAWSIGDDEQPFRPTLPYSSENPPCFFWAVEYY
jgi:hypothetical protein